MSEFQNIPLSLIDEALHNPRKSFDDAKLSELAESIKTAGVLQAITVRAKGKRFEIVCGARRVRAAKLAGLEEIPGRIMDLDDKQALEAAVIENQQRQDVSPLEEAEGYQALIEQNGLTVEEIARRLGKGETYIYTRLRLSKLIPEVRQALEEDKIVLKVADIISAVPDNVQPEVLKFALGDWNGPRSPGVIRTWLRNNLEQPIEKAKWDLSDALLIPAAGACSTCPKRSGANPGLFAAFDEKDVCPDFACWNSKMAAFIENEIREKGLERLSLVWRTTLKKTISSECWEECKTGTPKGSKLGIIVEGHRFGEIVRFKELAPNKPVSKPDSKLSEEEQQAKKTEERLARKEEIRLMRAESIARKTILTELDSYFKDPEKGPYLAAKCGESQTLLRAVSIHLALRSEQQWYSVKGASSAIDKDEACEVLRLPSSERGYHYLRDITPDAMKNMPIDAVRSWHSILICATRPELPVQDGGRNLAIVLEAFAEVADLDFELARKDADWATLSKKEQAIRLNAPKAEPVVESSEEVPIAPAKRRPGRPPGRSQKKEAVTA